MIFTPIVQGFSWEISTRELFCYGVSESKGDHSVTAVLERKSFAKPPFCLQFLEWKGSGLLSGGTERNLHSR